MLFVCYNNSLTEHLRKVTSRVIREGWYTLVSCSTSNLMFYEIHVIKVKDGIYQTFNHL